MKHRLIIVEGLPCSGKSTAARFLAEQCGMTFVDEGTGAHPADYENHAFLTKNEFLTLVDMIGEDDGVRLISAESEPTAGGIAVPLADWLEPEVSDFLLKRKIYDFLPWETEKPVMLQKWRDFAENADEDYVFNCVLLQNPMCETMMRFNMTEAESAAYIGEIAEIIRPLNPFVVYLKTTQAAENIRRTAPERGGWLDAVIAYHCGGGYGRANGLSGFEGYIAALEERQRRELAILETLGLPHLVLTDIQKDYGAAYAQMQQAVCK